jgi:hypothetical protein
MEGAGLAHGLLEFVLTRQATMFAMPKESGIR